VFLERFLDSNNKFEFSTYEVKDTSENRDAIDLNGDVMVEFYDEQEVRIYPHLSGGNWGSGWTTTNTGSPYYGNITFTNNSSNAYFTNTSSVVGETNTFEVPNIRSVKSKKSIETGRVEKGEKSNQQFTNSYQNFEYNVSHQISLKILPLSNKNKTTEDIKYYCTECGTKTKSKYKFCPSCGYDLNSKKETIIRYTDDVHETINGKLYTMSLFKLSLSKLLEIHSGKTIIIHKPSLSEDYLRAIIL
jgi:hypothetical protein